MLRSSDFSVLTYKVLKGLTAATSMVLESATNHEFYCDLMFKVPSDFQEFQYIDVRIVKWTHNFDGYPARDQVDVYFKVYYDCSARFCNESYGGYSKQFDYKEHEAIIDYLITKIHNGFKYLPPRFDLLDCTKFNLKTVTKKIIAHEMDIFYITQKSTVTDGVDLVQIVGAFDLKRFIIKGYYEWKENPSLVFSGKKKQLEVLDFNGSEPSQVELIGILTRICEVV